MDIDNNVVMPSDTFSSRIPLAVDVLNTKELKKSPERRSLEREIRSAKWECEFKKKKKNIREKSNNSDECCDTCWND